MSSSPVPKLPGYSVSIPPSLEKPSCARKHTLTYTKGYANEAPLSIVGEAAGAASPDLIAAHTYGSPEAGAAGASSPLPKWVTNDRKVLRFFGFYQEPVPESPIENHRVRKVILYYYLSDDTMHVAEPREDNSGLPQGIILRRSKIPRDPKTPEAGSLAPADLCVGAQVELYGKVVLLTDADEATRKWYSEELSVEQAGPQEVPCDPVNAYRASFGLSGKQAARSNDISAYCEAAAGKPSHLLNGDTLKQFLGNAGKVLRFWCVWDDRSGMYGDRRPFVLHYYLEDDTVEVNELHGRNDGRDPAPGFVKRGPLPKEAPRGDSLTGKVSKDKCYSPADLCIGGIVRVHGRDMLLHDCDPFTREWYKSELGTSDEELAAVEVKEPVEPLPRPAMPPYNGYGTLEDSRQNCVALVPKPPRKDMHKLMNKDKIILRFTARMVATERAPLSRADASRAFVASYFMMDDSVLIFEPPIRNSGIGGGKFLERQKIYKPESEEIYTCQDLYVGGQIEVFTRAFELTGADEFTYTYMENNSHAFLMADVEAAATALRAQLGGRADVLRAALAAADSQGSGYLDDSQLEGAFQAAGLHVTRHQVILLRRRLDREHHGSVSAEELVAGLGLGTAGH